MHGVLCYLRGTLGSFVLVLGVAALFAAPAFAQPQVPPSAPVTVVNTPANPVPVTATTPLPVTGTISLTQPVTVEETFAPGRSPNRYGPINAQFTGSLVGHELVPPVAAGKRFIVTHLNAVGFAGNSAIALVRGACNVQLRIENTYSPFMLLPAVNNGHLLAINEQVFMPLAAGEGLYVICSGVASDDTSPSQGFRMTAAGYFVPALP